MTKMIILMLAGICLLTGFITITTASTNILVESDHSYANNFDYTWPEISQPGATQIRLHFAKLDLATDTVYGDKLILFDKDGKELKTYTHYGTGDDFWTDWYAGDTLKLKLTTNGFNTAYGFKIDNVETRIDMAPQSVFPESYHSYANNFDYTWPEISQPGATQIRLHFAKLDLATDTVYGDKLILFDKDGKELKTYTHYGTGDDFWTDWYAGDTLKLKLTTNGFNTAYGFKIDNIETRPNLGFTPTESPQFAQTEASELSVPTTAPPTDVATNGNNTIDIINTVTKIGEGKDPAIYGNNVAWSNNGVHIYDLNTSLATQISLTGSYPTIYGNKIVWLDDIGGLFRLSIYDNSTGSTLYVTQNVDNSSKPAIYGNKIVWSANYNNGTGAASSGVYMCELPESSMELPVSSNADTEVPPSLDSLSSNTDKADYITPPTQDAYAAESDANPNELSTSFNANVTSGKAPLKVLFTSSTTGNPSTYLWIFEPSTSSDWHSKHAVTALHTFKNPGVYNVSLTVSNDAGSSTVTKNNYITVF